jgi:hypothetical protein
VHTSYERQQGSLSGFSSLSEKSGRSQDNINLKILNFWTKKVNLKNAALEKKVRYGCRQNLAK